MVKKYSDLYLEARRAFIPTEGVERAGFLARNLLDFVSGRTREQFLSDRETYASEEVCRAMEDAVQRILGGEPLAYVLGMWEFYGMELYVDKDVLIPRDDTCALAETAIKKALFLNQDPRILDLCTGSGCVGLAIANRVKDARVTLADISREALAVAKKNVTAHKLSGHVTCVQVDALKAPPAFLGQFDMIVSNPPYITTREMEELDDSVRNFEPHLALWGGEDGLDFYRAIADNYRACLKPGGYLAFEFGDGQGDDVCAILRSFGYSIVDRVRDYNQRERAVLAQYREEQK